MYINLWNNQKPMRNGFMAYGYHHEPQFYQLCLPGWCFQQIYMWLVKSCSELVKQILINAVKVDVPGYEDTLNYAFFNKQILFAFLTQFGACTAGKIFSSILRIWSIIYWRNPLRKTSFFASVYMDCNLPNIF